MALKIVSVTHEIRGDEIYVISQISNLGNTTKECRIYLYDGYSRLVDKEPDLSWKNIKPGQTFSIQTTSAWHPGSDLSTIGGAYTVQLKSKTGFWFLGDEVIEDQKTFYVTGIEYEYPVAPPEETEEQEIPPAQTPIPTVEPIPSQPGVAPTVIPGIPGVIPMLEPTPEAFEFPWKTTLIVGGVVVLAGFLGFFKIPGRRKL